MQTIESIFDDINTQLFTIHGTDDYHEITRKIINLANVITESDTDESTWNIGEYGECCLGDLIAGAYWHYTEWHSGMHSDGYMALSALGDIFSPGMSSAPESWDDDPCFTAYDALNDAARAYNAL